MSTSTDQHRPTNTVHYLLYMTPHILSFRMHLLKNFIAAKYDYRTATIRE